MKLSAIIRTFARQEDGTILVFWGMALVVVLGIVALSFDIGRLATTQSELQSYADHVALAAAGELDGRSDSITRATAAAANLISDTQSYGNGVKTLAGASDYTLDFYSTLPLADNNPLTLPSPNPSPPQPENAAYVQVVVRPKTVGFPFGSVLSTLLGGTTVTPSTDAVAVAGFTQHACDITPMMFCVPSGFDPVAEIGTMIHLRSGGGATGAWGPGNFAFLSPSGGFAADPNGPCGSLTGQQLERCLMGAESPISQCFSQRGVDMSPGQSVGSMASAVNVRFDLYDSTMQNFRDDPDYSPAPNVISGNVISRVGGGPNPVCSDVSSTDTVPLPRDDCFATGCTRGRIGDGNFSTGLANYIATNYGSAPAWFPANPQTRYEVYLAEIAASGGGNILTGRSETGRAICSSFPSSDPERRVLIAAGIDCAANAINGAKNNVPVDKWVKVFLTEPADRNTKDLFVEVLGTAQGNGQGGVIHDVVQLYR